MVQFFRCFINEFGSIFLSWVISRRCWSGKKGVTKLRKLLSCFFTSQCPSMPVSALFEMELASFYFLESVLAENLFNPLQIRSCHFRAPNPWIENDSLHPSYFGQHLVKQWPKQCNSFSALAFTFHTCQNHLLAENWVVHTSCKCN